jgi:hypothetical protein
MSYRWHDALYDVIVVQIPLAILFSLLICFDALKHLSNPVNIMDIASTCVITILLCFLILLMFVFLDLMLLPPLFGMVHFAIALHGHK